MSKFCEALIEIQPKKKFGSSFLILSLGHPEVLAQLTKCRNC